MLKNLKFLNFSIFFFFLFFKGCGEVIVYEADGNIKNIVTNKEITKKTAIDNQIINILNKYDDYNKFIFEIDKLNTNVIYNEKLLYIKNNSVLYKDVNGYTIVCLSIMYNKKDLYNFLYKNAKNKKKFLNYETLNGCTILKLVIYKNNSNLFKKLLALDELEVNLKYVDYSLKNNRIVMAYDLLNKIYKNSIPLKVYIKYAKNKKFKQRTLYKYFEDELLKKVINVYSLKKIITALNVNNNEKINLYILAYTKKNILPKNEKLKEIVLLKSNPDLEKNYYNINKLKNFIETFDFNRKDAKLIYTIAKKQLINLKFEKAYNSYNIKIMSKFINNYPNYSKNYLLKRRINEMKIYKEFGLDDSICMKSSFKWQGLFKKNYPVGQGCFSCKSNIRNGFFSKILQNSFICFKNVSLKKGYIETVLIKQGFLNNDIIDKKYTNFNNNIAEALVNNINKTIRAYNAKLKQLKNRVNCYEMKSKCIENCKFKNDKNGFFIFSESDKSKCKDNCNWAFFYCNKNELTKMKKYICYAKCVGYRVDNGGIFTSSDYEKCIKRCLGR